MTSKELELIRAEKNRIRSEWRQRNRDHINSYNKAWRASHRDQIKQRENERLLRKALARLEAEKSATTDE